jgi:hypothetical protein
VVRFVTILTFLRALAFLKRASVFWFLNIACDTGRGTPLTRGKSHLVLSKENTHA